MTTLASTNSDTLNFHQPKNIEARFPDLTTVLRKPEEAFASVILTPSLVIETLTALMKLNGDKPITLDLYRPADDKPVSFVGIRCDLPEINGKVEGALMPCSPPK